MDKVSIILPAFNCEDTIEHTIVSIQNQSYNNFELIIINDGSTDKTDEICKKIINNNTKIKYFKIQNLGVSFARNIGLEIATGKYLTFIDSDDLYDTNYLDILLKEIFNSNYDLVVCGYKTFGELEKEFNKKENFEYGEREFDLLVQNLQKKDLFNQVWNKIYDLEIIKKNNLKFDENLNLGEDYRFNINYLKFSNKVKYINKLLYYYRIKKNGLNFIYRKDRMNIEIENLKYLEKFYINKKYLLEYINSQYVKIYFITFLNIVGKSKYLTSKEKVERINEIITDEFYKKKIKFLKKNLHDIRQLFLLNCIFLKNKYMLFFEFKIITLIKK